jgi:hypothetical protein
MTMILAQPVEPITVIVIDIAFEPWSFPFKLSFPGQANLAWRMTMIGV